MTLTQLVRKLRHPFNGNPSDVGDCEVKVLLPNKVGELGEYNINHVVKVDEKILVYLDPV